MSNSISGAWIDHRLDQEDPSFVYTALSYAGCCVEPVVTVLLAAAAGRQLGHVAKRTYNSYYPPAQTPPRLPQVPTTSTWLRLPNSAPATQTNMPQRRGSTGSDKPPPDPLTPRWIPPPFAGQT
jgi:hypothetical protein